MNIKPFDYSNLNGVVFVKSCDIKVDPNAPLHLNYPASFTGTRRPNEIPYVSALHYEMFKKAIIFEDKESSSKLMNSELPKYFEGGVNDIKVIEKFSSEIEAVGNSVSKFDQSVWDLNRIHVLKLANCYKFAQNPKILEMLRSTGKSTIIYVSEDPVLGIGLSLTEAGQTPPTQWPGKNAFGLILMEVRLRLRTSIPDWCAIVQPSEEDSLRRPEGKDDVVEEKKQENPLSTQDIFVKEPEPKVEEKKDEVSPVAVIDETPVQETIETTTPEDEPLDSIFGNLENKSTETVNPIEEKKNEVIVDVPDVEENETNEIDNIFGQ